MAENECRCVRIVGGMSWAGTIKILSDRYVSSATCDRKNREILCSVRRRSTGRIPFPFRKSEFFPKVIRLIANLWVMSGKFGKTVMLALLTLTLLPIAFLGFDGPKEPVSDIVFFSGNIFLLVGVALLVRQFIGTWHAAEHMLIRTYTDHGRTDLETAMTASRIDPYCGGRFLVPLLIISHLALPIGYWMDFNVFVIQLVLMEVLLRIDSSYGIHRIPVLSHASEALQRYVTTREPGEIELTTAQIAINGLLHVHHEDFLEELQTD